MIISLSVGLDNNIVEIAIVRVAMAVRVKMSFLLVMIKVSVAYPV